MRWKNYWQGKFSPFPVSTVPIRNKVIKHNYNLQEELGRIEKKYGSFSPASFLPSDRFLTYYDREEQRLARVDPFTEVGRSLYRRRKT